MVNQKRKKCPVSVWFLHRFCIYIAYVYLGNKILVNFVLKVTMYVLIWTTTLHPMLIESRSDRRIVWFYDLNYSNRVESVLCSFYRRDRLNSTWSWSYQFEPSWCLRYSDVCNKFHMIVISCLVIGMKRVRWCLKANILKFNLQLESIQNHVYIEWYGLFEIDHAFM